VSDVVSCCRCSQVTLSVAKRPFGDDFVEDSASHMSYSEVPWQLQHLYSTSDMAHVDPRHQPAVQWMTDLNARPLPSPPCMYFSAWCCCVYVRQSVNECNTPLNIGQDWSLSSEASYILRWFTCPMPIDCTVSITVLTAHIVTLFIMTTSLQQP